MQAKLPRVLQEKEIERVGGTAARIVDLRIIAATGKPLEYLVKEGRFRADLYYRIHVIPIHIPPLRGRREDIEAISNHFPARISCESGEIKRSISPELGLELVEVAPGIDLKKDILDLMGFEPNVRRPPRLMDFRIFRSGPMGLKDDLLGLETQIASFRRTSESSYAF
jgi:hypothetical protein